MLTKSNSEGKAFAFEVATFPIGRGGVYRVIKNIEGVKIIRRPLPIIGSLFGEEEFCIFELNNIQFSASEMFGGSAIKGVVMRLPQ